MQSSMDGPACVEYSKKLNFLKAARLKSSIILYADHMNVALIESQCIVDIQSLDTEDCITQMKSLLYRYLERNKWPLEQVILLMESRADEELYDDTCFHHNYLNCLQKCSVSNCDHLANVVFDMPIYSCAAHSTRNDTGSRPDITPRVTVKAATSHRHCPRK